MKRSKLVMLACGLLLLSAAASAYSIEEQEIIDQYKKDFDKTVERMQKNCGVPIKVDYALSSEPKNMKEVTHHPPGYGYSVCAEAAEGILSACNDKTAKPVVAKKIKELKCRFKLGTSDAVQAKTPHRFNAFAMKGKTLSFEFDHLGGNTAQETLEFIMKSL